MKKSRIVSEQAAPHPPNTSNRNGPGRPGISKSEVLNRAWDYTLTFEQSWELVKEALLDAETAQGFRTAIGAVPNHIKRKFPVEIFRLILRIRKDPKFPSSQRAQVKFFAESLAGDGRVTPRRSRDICAEARRNPANMIIRRDYYIECTCEYKGPAYYQTCPKCKTSTVSMAASMPHILQTR